MSIISAIKSKFSHSTSAPAKPAVANSLQGRTVVSFPLNDVPNWNSFFDKELAAAHLKEVQTAKRRDRYSMAVAVNLFVGIAVFLITFALATSLLTIGLTAVGVGLELYTVTKILTKKSEDFTQQCKQAQVIFNQGRHHKACLPIIHAWAKQYLALQGSEILTVHQIKTVLSTYANALAQRNDLASNERLYKIINLFLPGATLTLPSWVFSKEWVQTESPISNTIKISSIQEDSYSISDPKWQTSLPSHYRSIQPLPLFHTWLNEQGIKNQKVDLNEMVQLIRAYAQVCSTSHHITKVFQNAQTEIPKVIPNHTFTPPQWLTTLAPYAAQT